MGCCHRQTLKILTGHTDDVESVSFSPDGQILASASLDGTVLFWNPAPTENEPTRLAADVNHDGQVNIQDLVAVAAAFGEMEETPADVNRDGQVNIQTSSPSSRAFGQSGHSPAGVYQSRARAAHWDGKNKVGEPVASGLYFYTLTAGEFTATRKLLIRK